jgi:hypothetical protein
MKSKVIFSILIVGIMMATIASNAMAAPTYSFTLTATGKAYDPYYHVWRTVTLTITGTAVGTRTTYANLNPKGSLTVQKWGTFRVLGGSGVLMPKCHYIMLNMKITPVYGGSATASWSLRGSTGSWNGNRLPITLSADRVYLPLLGRPILYWLKLTGTIRIS